MTLELTLTLLALLCAGIVPNAFVGGGLGLAPMSTVATYVLLPAAVVQVAILVYARAAGQSRLFNRLITGLWVGAVATTGLDVVRQPGTVFGYLAHDEARMAGEMILGADHGREPKHATSDRHGASEAQPPPAQSAAAWSAPSRSRPASDPHAPRAGAPAAEPHEKPATPGHQGSTSGADRGMAHGAGHDHVTTADFVGYAYHYWNGASFAAIYALLAGRTPWWGPLVYSIVFIETGMLVFMRLAMGPLAAGTITVSLLAHVAYGAVMGVLLHRFVRDTGSILEVLPRSPQPRGAPA
ncbi:MAG: DUF6789 family protein [Candidatus Rokuibacteriota bacterium]